MDIEERDLEDLIAYFIALKNDGRDPAEFRRRFDLMALQRNLKALGTFGFQTTTRRNTVYLQYVPRTLRYARSNLAKYPRFARLRAILSTAIDELR
jgi:aminoglycoside/choline kinase family phosphotransferase